MLVMFMFLFLALAPAASQAASRTIAWDYPATTAQRAQETTPPTLLPSHPAVPTPPEAKQETAEVAAASVFVVRRSVDGGPLADIGTVPLRTGSDIQYTDTTLPERETPYQVTYQVFVSTGSGISPGSNELKITVTGTPALVSTFHLSPTGNDAATCVQAQQALTPKKTWASVAPCMGGGSTLYLREGTYPPLDTSVTPIRGGASWQAPTTIASFPGETATIRPVPGGPAVMAFFRAPATDAYIILDRLVLDAQKMAGTNGFVCRDQVHHIRFQRGAIKNSYYEPVFLADSDTCEVVGSDIAGNVMVGGVGLENTKNVRLEANIIHDIQGHGIAWSAERPNTNVLVARNRIERFTETGIVLGGAWSAVNNLILGGKIGIRVGKDSTNVALTHDTISGASGPGVQIDSGAGATTLTNMLLFGNGSPLADTGTGTVQAGTMTTDPSFVMASGGDYHLKPGSPAIDAGAVATGVTTDLANTPRPQGAGYDVGAYEATPGGETPTEPTTGEIMCTYTVTETTATLTCPRLPEGARVVPRLRR
jgi:Right handed beta helix region